MSTPKQYEVVISNKARDELGKIIGHVAIESIVAAKKLQQEIIKSIGMLAYFPHSAPYLAGEYIPYNKYRKLVVVKRYLVIYQFKNETVYVEYVLDTKQDWQWLVR